MTGGESIVDFGSLTAWTRVLALLTGAVRRRWVSIAVLAGVFTAAGVGAAVVLPRAYSTQASLLIKRSYVMPALANPRRAVPTGADSPTQSAAEFVLSHESRLNIVRTNRLLARWDADRPALLQLKDRAMNLVRGLVPEHEKEDVLVELLAKRISVRVEDEVVTVKATWTDREMARDLVNSAVDTFLDVRRKIDVQAIADTYTILKRTADEERARVDAQLAMIAEAQRAAAGNRTAGEPVMSRRAEAARSVPTPSEDARLTPLRARILVAQSTAAGLGAAHRDQLVNLERKLAERRAAQTERHPDVVALTAALDRLRPEPTELAAARAGAAELVAEYAARGGSLERLTAADPSAGALVPAADRPAGPEAAAVVIREKPEEDDTVVYARSLFKGSLQTYQDILDRLRDVEIELATAEVAFNYRYTITAPARLSKKADSPNVPLILLGALLAGVAAAIVRAVFKELQDRSLLSPAAFVAHLAAPATEAAAS